MIKICIVEDEKEQAELLKSYIEKYFAGENSQVTVEWLQDGMDLVDDYKSQYDIIFLDIQMKHLNGMEAAEKVRRIDQDVALIFITSTVNYAVQGYAVDALGYVLKPVPYVAFAQLLEKAIVRVNARQKKVYIRVSTEDKQMKLEAGTIYYIESKRNNVVLHTNRGEFVTSGPLKKFEELLEGHGFCKCHNAYVVNLSFVEAVQKEELTLTNGEVLPISRARKKEFMAALTEDIL